MTMSVLGGVLALLAGVGHLAMTMWMASRSRDAAAVSASRVLVPAVWVTWACLGPLAAYFAGLFVSLW